MKEYLDHNLDDLPEEVEAIEDQLDELVERTEKLPERLNRAQDLPFKNFSPPPHTENSTPLPGMG
jgi:hypothetical protein